MILRSLDSNKQARPVWQRPGFKEPTRALKNLQNAEGQGVPFIPVKLTTRQNNILDPELQEILERLSFNWAEYFAKTQNSECQQPSSSSSSWSPSPTWWSSLMGGKTKNWTKGKERQRQVHAPHSLKKLLAVSENFNVVQVNLCLDSIKHSSFFYRVPETVTLLSCFFWQCRVWTVATAVNATGWCRQHTCLCACPHFSRALMTFH